ILNSANVDRAYDGLLWTLRSLQELSSALLLPNSMMKISSMPPSTLNEVDAALALLSNITSNDLVDTCLIPQDVWDLQFFKRPTS
ncbi:hypothetical protein TSUD_134490, partial [Trifolium subterraneum]